MYHLEAVFPHCFWVPYVAYGGPYVTYGQNVFFLIGYGVCFKKTRNPYLIRNPVCTYGEKVLFLIGYGIYFPYMVRILALNS